MMNLEQASYFLLEEAKKRNIPQFDIVVGISQSTAVEVFEGRVKNTEISHGTGIGIRLFLDGRPGISYTERFTKDSILQCLEDAISNSKLTDTLEIELPAPVELPNIDLQIFNPELEQTTFEELVNYAVEMEELGLKADPRIENAPYVGTSKSSGEAIFCNSKGVYYYRKSNSLSGWIGLTAKQGEQKKMGYYGNTFKSPGQLNTKYMAQKATERATELLGAEPIPSGKYPVVFSNRVSGSILGMFLGAYTGEAITKGQSRLVGKLEEKIASDVFTMICDPLVVGMPGSRLLDGEGVPTKRQEFVSKGVLINYLQNLESAKKMKVEPTGNGSRSYGGKAGTTVSNLIVPLGNYSLDELLKMYSRCVLVTKLEGSSGCSTLSGDISIGVQGFYCEKGEKTKPIDKITLNTNYYDLIQNIEAFDNEYLDTYSSIKVPSFLIKEAYIAS
jgi:PmbA protein